MVWRQVRNDVLSPNSDERPIPYRVTRRGQPRGRLRQSEELARKIRTDNPLIRCLDVRLIYSGPGKFSRLTALCSRALIVSQRDSIQKRNNIPLKTGTPMGTTTMLIGGIAGAISSSPRLSFWIKSSSTKRIFCEANAAYSGVTPKYQDRVVLTGEWVKRTGLTDETLFLFSELKILKP
jgi:hypothetical protein